MGQPVNGWGMLGQMDSQDMGWVRARSVADILRRTVYI